MGRFIDVESGATGMTPSEPSGGGISSGIGGVLGAMGGLAGPLGFVGNLIGGIMQNDANRDIADKNNAMSQSNAREQMAFQEKMSNTSYQRGMEDMRKAGLNPMLAFSQGGASAPSGASGSVTSAHMENVMGPAVSSAMQGMQLKTQLENTASGTELNKAVEQTNKTIQAKNLADAVTSAKQAQKLNTENKLLQKGLPRADLENKVTGWMSDKVKQYWNSDGKTLMDNHEKLMKGETLP